MYTYGNPCQSEKAGQKQQRNDLMSLTTLWDYDLFFVPSRRAGMEFCLARGAFGLSDAAYFSPAETGFWSQPQAAQFINSCE
jgi:hypothetical protein